MIDPNNITNYDYSDNELQEFITFAIAVAGKNATTIRKAMVVFYSLGNGKTPFKKISNMIKENCLLTNLKDARLGRYNTLEKAFRYLVDSDIDLRTCSMEELEKCPGIGYKTSRFFILHTRKDQEVAVLDTHILHWLRDFSETSTHLRYLMQAAGISTIPKSTPGRKLYLKLEKIFIQLCKESKISIADADLALWRQYSGNNA